MPTWRDIRQVDNLRALADIRQLTSQAIQSQYSASRRILALAEDFQHRLDPAADCDIFYRNVFDILSAKGWGLDNWGRILGMGRTIVDPDTETALTLDDENFRLLLLYKAMANIASADAAALNELINLLGSIGIPGFPDRAYVLEVDTMVIRWVFEETLNAEQVAVFKAAGTLARGAGVGWELYALDPGQVFGFDGSAMHPFNQRPFASDNALIVNRG